MSLLDILQKGGIVAWVLLGYSVVALTIVIERLVHFYRLERLPEGFGDDLKKGIRSGTAHQLLHGRSGPEVTLVRALLQASADGVKDLTRVATRVGSAELQRMERGLRTLGVLGNTAPLCGLLGTVAGVIGAFQAIEKAGGAVQVNQLAGGIWEAMVTTGMGMAVALPALLLLHMLEGLADHRAQSMRHYASLTLEYLPHAEREEDEAATHHREGVVHEV